MSTLSATVDAVSLVSECPTGVGSATYGVRRVYLLSCSFATYASTDNAKIANVAATIAAAVRDGRTYTWGANAVQALCAGPGTDTAGQAVYAGTFAVSTNDVTFNLTDATGTELSSATASSGVQVLVAVDAL